MFAMHGLRSLPFWTSKEGGEGMRVAYGDPYVQSVIEKVEANFEDIKAEYMSAVMGVGHGAGPSPMQSDYDVAGKGADHPESLHEGSWDWHSYVQKGQKMDLFKQRCPKTAKVLDNLPLFETPFGFAFFSTLHPKSRIKPHSGPMNLRLRVHLPLVVGDSQKCRLNVGGQERHWEEGKCVVLDDSHVHEAYNDGELPRVVLLFDIWHPDIDAQERDSIVEMFNYSAQMGWLSNN